jgi:AraC-like DNA-binding protein
MMLLDAFRPDKNRQERQLRLFLSLTYTVGALCWMGLVLYTSNHRAFVYYHTVFLLTLMLDQVLIYRFVHIITATERNQRFNRLHFVLPAALTAISALSSLNTPFDQQMAAIYGESGGDSWFAAVYSATGVVFILYNTLYPLLGLWRICRYKRNIVDYSADVQRTSLNWLAVMQALTLLTVPVPLAGLLLGVDVFSGFWSSMQGTLPTFIVYPVLCYNLLSDNYVIIAPDDDTLPVKAVEIVPRRFSQYMREKKPYLNPKLRITDVAAGLNTNRNYVSAFINKEYGMNFSCFINRCRLEELDRMRLSPKNKDMTNMELVLGAGFSCYRSYLRVKSEEEESRVLKAF